MSLSQFHCHFWGKKRKNRDSSGQSMLMERKYDMKTVSFQSKVLILIRQEYVFLYFPSVWFDPFTIMCYCCNFCLKKIPKTSLLLSRIRLVKDCALVSTQPNFVLKHFLKIRNKMEIVCKFLFFAWTVLQILKILFQCCNAISRPA